MRVLVTGGAGFIGSHLVDRLLELNHDVTVFDSLDPQVHEAGARPTHLSPASRFVHGDVRDYDALAAAACRAEVIFHQACAVGVGQSQYQIKHYVDVNVGGTANLLDILANRSHSVVKLIVAASMSSYGEGLYRCADCGQIKPPLRTEQIASGWNPSCPECAGPIEPVATPESARLDINSVYALTKRAQEDLVLGFGKTYGLPVVSLRYFNVYGPRQSLNNPYTGVAAIFISRLKNGRPPVIYEDGLQTRDFVSVHDVVAANLLAMERTTADFERFNVGSGTPQTIKGVAEALAGVLGQDTAPQITQKFRKGDVRHCHADLTKIREKLGYSPQVSLEEGFERLAEWSAETPAEDRFETAAGELERRGLV